MSTVPESCDVVVIGGGPSGSLAATYLTGKGYSVALFEKEKHPRYQVGESLLPDVWKYCDAAGVSDAIAAEGFLRKAGGSVDWNGDMRRLSFGDFGYTRPALHVERDRFDHLAGAQCARLGRLRRQVFEHGVELRENKVGVQILNLARPAGVLNRHQRNDARSINDKLVEGLQVGLKARAS